VAGFLERPSPPYTAVGLAARPSAPDAAFSAALEALATHVCLREWLATDPAPPTFPPETLYDHARVHAVRPELAGSRRRWLAPRAVARERTARGQNWRDARGLDRAVCVDLTTPDVAAVGVRVVRAIIPGRVPLDADARHPRLAGNPVPHPFG
jgi:ribosomal protein S12 methylthiotransferase accessory factor